MAVHHGPTTVLAGASEPSPVSGLAENHLGYQQAADWQRLRVTNVLHHHGERLLTFFQRQYLQFSEMHEDPAQT